MTATTPHPTAVVVERADPKRDRHYTPQSNNLLAVAIQPETAPKPVEYTSFFGVGRTEPHARAHIWRYQALAIADKLSIMAPNFLFPKVPSALVVGMNTGRMNPAEGRPNVIQPDQTTVGARSAIQSPLTFAPQYAKLV